MRSNTNKKWVRFGGRWEGGGKGEGGILLVILKMVYCTPGFVRWEKFPILPWTQGPSPPRPSGGGQGDTEGGMGESWREIEKHE